MWDGTELGFARRCSNRHGKQGVLSSLLLGETWCLLLLAFACAEPGGRGSLVWWRVLERTPDEMLRIGGLVSSQLE